MPEKHNHDYNKIELFRIVKVQHKYKGSAGDKAILYRKCKCGKGKAFELGDYKLMLKMQKELTHG